MDYQGIQSLLGWRALGVQLSPPAALPPSESAKMSLSDLDVQVFPQITWALSICTASWGLLQGGQGHQHMQAWECLQSSLGCWPEPAGGQCRHICRCEYLY